MPNELAFQLSFSTEASDGLSTTQGIRLKAYDSRHVFNELFVFIRDIFQNFQCNQQHRYSKGAWAISLPCSNWNEISGELWTRCLLWEFAHSMWVSFYLKTGFKRDFFWLSIVAELKITKFLYRWLDVSCSSLKAPVSGAKSGCPHKLGDIWKGKKGQSLLYS